MIKYNLNTTIDTSKLYKSWIKDLERYEEESSVYENQNMIDLLMEDRTILSSSACELPKFVSLIGELQSISITTPPTKTVYHIGDLLDTTGMVVTATFSNIVNQVTGYIIDLSDQELQLSTNKFVVSYTFNGVTKQATCPITVETYMTNLRITTPPNKLEYSAGELLNLTGMVVTAYYDDGSSKVVTDYEVTHINTVLKVTDTVLEVVYTAGAITKTATYPITVTTTLDSIEITTPPNKTKYSVGDAIDTTGMVVTAYYSDGNSEEITTYSIDIDRPIVLEDVGFTISYTYDTITKTAYQPISTNRVFTNISITTPPNVVTYGDGDIIDFTGMVVTATFEDGETEILGYTVDKTIASMVYPDVTVSYTYDDITKTATLPLTVGIARRYVSVGLLSGDTTTGIPTAEYSTDGITWTSTELPGTGAYYSVAYGNKVFIAVGSSGNIAKSEDGITWVSIKETAGLNTLYDYTTIIFAENTFICANDNGVIYKSTDLGETWTSYVNRSVFLEGFKGKLSYIKGKLYFTGYSEGTSVLNGNLTAWSTNLGLTWNIDETTLCGIRGVIDKSPVYIANEDNSTYYSTNGVDWVPAESTCTYDGYLSFGNDTFISLYKNPDNDENSRVYISRDGFYWLSATIQMSYTSGVLYAGNKFVTFGYNNHQYYSEDGVSWTMPENVPNGTFYDMATSFQDDITSVDLPLDYPDIDLTGLTLTTNPTKMEYVSGDIFDDEGMVLTASFTTGDRQIDTYKIDDPYITDAHSSVYLSYSFDNRTFGVYIDMLMVLANKRYMVLHNEGYSYSTDLTTWVDTEQPNTSETMLGLYCNNGTFITTGTNGASFYSSNGVRWYAMYGLDTNYTYQAITNIGDQSIVVSNYGGKAYRTSDYKNWVDISNGLDSSDRFQSIASDNQKAIIVGYSGASYYTEDCTSWTSISGISTALKAIDIAYGNGVFLCVTEEGRIYKLSDTLEWVTLEDVITKIRAIAYGNGKFVILGINKIYSYDSTTLRSISTVNISSTLNDISYSHGRFVAVGNNGVLYTSVDGLSWVTTNGLDTARNYTVVSDSYCHKDSLSLNTISVDTFPNKTEYYDDELLDLTGLKLLAEYTDTSDDSIYAEEILDYTCDTTYVDFDNASVTFSFTYKGITKTTSMMLTIKIRKRYVTVGVHGKSYYSLDHNTWIPMTGLDDSVTYRRVAYGNGRFITVGPSGLSYYSTDGKEWHEMTGLDIVYNLLGVAFGNNTFVCVGYDGKSYYSIDGVSWTPMGDGLYVAEAYADVIYGNDRFVTVGYEGASCYSLDGRTWNTMTGLDKKNDYIAVTYGNNRFIAVGNNGHSYYSTDGETWERMTGLDTNEHFWGVTYANGAYVCVGTHGKSYCSMNGVKWKPMTGLNESINYWSVTYGDGVFVCVGYKGESYYSEDGKTWSPFNGLDTSTNFLGITDNFDDGDDLVLQSISITNPPTKIDYVDGEEIDLDGIEVIGHFLDKDREVGYIIENTLADVNHPVITVSYTYNGVTCTDTLTLHVIISEMYMVVGQDGSSCTSTNGFTWSQNVAIDTTYTIMGIAFGNDRYVGILSGNAYYSIDGKTWKTTTGLSTNATYRAITYGGDRFIIVGQKGTSYYSLDGVSWTSMPGLFLTNTYYCVIYGNDKYVCGGDNGTIYYSTDGTSWQKTHVAGIATTSGAINDIVYGDNRFIAIGDSGNTYTSTDGVTWAPLSGIAITNNLLAVAYGNNKFVCTGVGGVSYSMTSDSMTWEEVEGLPETSSVRSITYANNTFVCVYNRQAYYTVDGITWNTLSTLPIQAYAIENNFK